MKASNDNKDLPIVVYSVLLFSQFILAVVSVYGFIERGEYDGLIALFIFIIIIDIPLFFLRKGFFCKMFINEEGIVKYYKKTILAVLRWEHIKDAKVFITRDGFSIFLYSKQIKDFKDYKDTTIKEAYIDIKNTMCIETGTIHFEYLCRYKDKIPVEIRDLELLPPYYKNQLEK